MRHINEMHIAYYIKLVLYRIYVFIIKLVVMELPPYTANRTNINALNMRSYIRKS